MHGNSRQHLRHHPISAALLEQEGLQPFERFRHVGKRSPIPERTGFPFDQADVMAEIVEGEGAFEAAHMTGDLLTIGHQLQAFGIDAQTDHPMRQFIRYAVAIALEMDQSRAGDAHRLFDVAVEGTWIGKQLQLFVFM